MLSPQLSCALQSFDKATLHDARTVEKGISDMLAPTKPSIDPPPTEWVKTADGRREVPRRALGRAPASMRAAAHEAHGRCYGFESERDSWALPRLRYHTELAARPGYDTRSASEYVDAPEVMAAKVRALAAMVRRASRVVVYAGAGLSTAAGIDDYATRSRAEPAAPAAPAAPALRSPMCAQPTLAHRVLVGLHAAGHVYRLVQQNHDGLPQKAGFPPAALNEIHGALHAPDNPVVPMAGRLRADLAADLEACAASADLVVAVGTSLAGMSADAVVHAAAARAAARAALGAVVVGLQRTSADGDATLRIFGECDAVFGALAAELGLGDAVPPARPTGTFFRPPVLAPPAGAAPDDDDDGAVDARYRLRGVRFDAMGRALGAAAPAGCATDLDLRDGARLVVPSGPYAGAQGEVDGRDREGHPRCRFMVRLKQGSSFKVPSMMALGTWWLQAAADASVHQLPVVNPPSEHDLSPAATELRSLVSAYS
jgi:NAD-dependent SIR2 family protein deacetylase